MHVTRLLLPCLLLGAQLDISEKTVEAHRARVMQKTLARSIAELVQFFIAAEFEDL